MKSLLQTILGNDKIQFSHKEAFIRSALLKKSINKKIEKMDVEDLAALDYLTEDSILRELESRLSDGNFHSYIGDVLLILNPNENQNIYGKQV